MKRPVFTLLWLGHTLISCGYGEEQSHGQSSRLAPPLSEWTPPEFAAIADASSDTSFIHTESRYAAPDGQTVLFQNSFPKGGSYLEPGGEVGYTTADGTRYGIGVFWTRVVNESGGPFTLSLRFPADSFALAAPDAYYRLSLPTDTMTLAKRSEFNYGIRRLKPFFDQNLDRPTSLKHTLATGEEYLFYVALLIHAPQNGPIRTALEADATGALRYRVRVEPLGEQSFSAGRIER